MDSFLKTQKAALREGRFFLSAARFFFALFWLTFPFQVRTLLFDLQFYSSGNFNPYTTFFLSLSDLLLVLTSCFFGVALLRKEFRFRLLEGTAKWLMWLLLAFAASLLLTVFWASEPFLAFLSSLRFFEWTFLVWLLVQEVLPISRVLFFFGAGLFLQAALAVAQTLWQGSVFRGGMLDRLGAFLGEPLFGTTVSGAAKMDIGSVKMVRAYGTFPHPNVLAGALGMFLFLLSGSGGRFFLVVLLMLALVFTFSRSALFALLLGFFGVLVFSGLLLRHWKRYLLLFGVALIFLAGTFFTSEIFRERFGGFNDPASFFERVMYLEAAGDMFLAHPFGVGVSHFTLALPDFVETSLPPWEFQPVHNVYVLAFAEGGLLSGVLFMSLWFFVFVVLLVRLFFTLPMSCIISKTSSAGQAWQKDRLWAALLLGCGTFLLIVSLFDHYLFTLPQGQVLLYFYFGLVAVFLQRKFTVHCVK